ncbi:hypothetical protein KKD49_09860 [Myxococcota bacterium]|nr:hypothetical protein [Myxococcota bacterium]
MLWFLIISACQSTTNNDTNDAATDIDSTHDAEDVETDHWAVWEMNTEPVFTGQYGIVAGDPSIIRNADEYLMYYTCYAVDISGAETCLARSPDGINWSMANTGNSTTIGRVLYPGIWDEGHETPFALYHEMQIYLYYTGYSDAHAGIFGSPSAPIGLAVSDDFENFESLTDQPVVDVNPDYMNEHGMTSPSIVKVQGGWMMVFAGWCLKAGGCSGVNPGKYTTIMSAYSEDLINWTYENTALIENDAVPWAVDGLAEPFIIIGDDNRYYLFFTAVNNSTGHSIGLAVSSNPYGPWNVSPEPILIPNGEKWTNKGVLAPHVLFDEMIVKMWFSGEELDENGNPAYRTGYAEAYLPIAP